MNLGETFTLAYLILLIVGLVVNSIGFKKYVYFGSVGYNFAIAAFGITTIAMYLKYMSISILFSCILFIIYGCRGGLLLLTKEKNSSSYQRFISEKTKGDYEVDGVTKYITWLLLTILYTFQVSPIFYTISNLGRALKKLNMAFVKNNPWYYVTGTIVMAVGLFIIVFSDLLLTKSGNKKKKRLNNTGFFEFIKGGSFIGDLVFWTGVLILGYKELPWTIQKVFAIIGYGFVLFYIFGGAKRIFKK